MFYLSEELPISEMDAHSSECWLFLRFKVWKLLSRIKFLSKVSMFFFLRYGFVVPDEDLAFCFYGHCCVGICSSRWHLAD